MNENLSYEEVTVDTLDRQVKKLRNKASIKVLWINHLVKGATWKAEAYMKSRYPHLFLKILAKVEVNNPFKIK